ALSGHASTGGEPPVIKAEQAPIKTPAAPTNDGQVKQTYDRVGDRGGERMQSREEQPVDPRSVARAPSAPGAHAPPGATGPALPPSAAPTGSRVGAGSEPKKVKPVAIRPDNPPPPSQAVPPLRPATPTAAPTVPVRPVATPAPAPAPTRSLDSGSFVVQVA